VGDKNVIELRDANEAVVQIQLTEPFFCDYPGCFFDLTVYLPETDECALPTVAQTYTDNPCGLSIRNSDVGHSLNLTLANIGYQNQQRINNQFYLFLKTGDVPNDVMLSNIVLPPIKVCPNL